MVLAALRIRRVVERRAAKFRCPDHQRVFQQPAPLQVRQQCRDRLVDVLREWGVAHHVAVGVPVIRGADVDQFHESDAAFDQAAGDEALPREAGRAASRQAVQLQGLVGFLGEIEGLGGGGLHPERNLEALHPRRECRILAIHRVTAIQLGEGVEFLPLLNGRHPRFHVRHRFRGRHHGGALMSAWQEVRGPHLTPGIRAVRRDHHERRQVLVRAAEPVTHPRTEARPGDRERASVHAERSVVVVRVARVHRSNQGDVVGHPGHVREEFADFRARFAAFLELPLRLLEEELLVARPIARLRMIEGDLLAVIGGELRLRVETIDVRDAAAHEQEDDALGLTGKVRRLRCECVGPFFGQHLAEECGHE